MQKKGGGVRGAIFLIFSIFLILIISSFASAGFFDWFKKTITGRATSGQTNVSVAITGTSMVAIKIWNQTLTGALVTPSAGTSINLSFNVTIIDSDGNADINDSSVSANFSLGGVERRTENACSLNTGQTTASEKNFTCSIDMWYFDANNTWVIRATANDIGNTTYNMTTASFSYGATTAVEIYPSLITFPALSPGDTNKTSLLNTTLNNTGNVIINPDNIKVNAIDLQGITDTSYYLGVANFTSSWDNAAGPPPGSCSGTSLVNATATGITGANLTRGNLTIADGRAQEVLYYCIVKVPPIPSQIYATNNSGAWVISVV